MIGTVGLAWHRDHLRQLHASASAALRLKSGVGKNWKDYRPSASQGQFHQQEPN
jgi:hypothetical protein